MVPTRGVGPLCFSAIASKAIVSAIPPRGHIILLNYYFCDLSQIFNDNLSLYNESLKR